MDLSEHALGIARKSIPPADLRVGTITELPFGDSSVDFVFTHQLLNYLDDDTLGAGIAEMYRVAGRYIMNCEKFKEGEAWIDERHRYRDMLRRWMDYRVKVVSNVDMHEDIDPDRSRFTLLKKMG